MANPLKIRVGGTLLPGEVTGLKRGDELLWSEGTGRSASSGAMTGSVVAAKETWTVEWGVITAAQYNAIKAACGRGFKSLVITAGSTTLADVTAYRGAITGELLSVLSGTPYYKNVTAEFVER